MYLVYVRFSQSTPYNVRVNLILNATVASPAPAASESYIDSSLPVEKESLQEARTSLFFPHFFSFSNTLPTSIIYVPFREMSDGCGEDLDWSLPAPT